MKTYTFTNTICFQTISKTKNPLELTRETCCKVTELEHREIMKLHPDDIIEIWVSGDFPSAAHGIYQIKAGKYQRGLGLVYTKYGANDPHTGDVWHLDLEACEKIK